MIIYNGHLTKKIYAQKSRVRANLAVEWDRKMKGQNPEFKWI